MAGLLTFLKELSYSVLLGACTTLLLVVLILLLVPHEEVLQTDPLFWQSVIACFGVFSVQTAMLARIAWAQSFGGAATNCGYFFHFMLRESSIQVMTIAWFSSGALAERQDARHDGNNGCNTQQSMQVRQLAMSVLGYCALVAVLLEGGVKIYPSRLLRCRTGWHRGFVLGCAVTAMFSFCRAQLAATSASQESANVFSICHLLNATSANQDSPSAGGDVCETVVVSLSVLFMVSVCVFSVLCLRNSAVHGLALSQVVEMYLTWNYCDAWLIVLTQCIPVVLLVLAAGTTETSRDTRVMVSLVWLTTCALRLGGQTGSDADTGRSGSLDLQELSRLLIIPAVFCYGHAAKFYMLRGRDVQHWREAIGFLKFSEIRRRRRADKGFVLSRRQDMDRNLFGDPTNAKYIIVVSHAWLSPAHADPDGMHLDIAISTIEEKLYKNSSLRKSCKKVWWQYYYLESEGDILIFFDMSSLTQHPRTPLEDKAFKHSLGLMNILYYSFEVLVIPDIPDTVLIHGHGLEYMDKGWCWAEAEIACIGNKLSHLSTSIISQLDKERQKHDLFGPHFALGDALWGMPRYEPQVLQQGMEQEFFEHREKQAIRGKVFTNGKFDLDQVGRILATVERKLKLREYLEAGDTKGVEDIFQDDFFLQSHGGMTREELANTVFDGKFTTPLHLAVAADSIKLVAFLMAEGAQPRPDFYGRMPWERYALVPSFCAAALVARTPPPLAVVVARIRPKRRPSPTPLLRMSSSSSQVSPVRLAGPSAAQASMTSQLSPVRLMEPHITQASMSSQISPARLAEPLAAQAPMSSQLSPARLAESIATQASRSTSTPQRATHSSQSSAANRLAERSSSATNRLAEPAPQRPWSRPQEGLELDMLK